MKERKEGGDGDNSAVFHMAKGGFMISTPYIQPKTFENNYIPTYTPLHSTPPHFRGPSSMGIVHTLIVIRSILNHGFSCSPLFLSAPTLICLLSQWKIKIKRVILMKSQEADDPKENKKNLCFRLPIKSRFIYCPIGYLPSNFFF